MEIHDTHDDKTAVLMTDDEINRLIDTDEFDEDELPDEWFHNL